MERLPEFVYPQFRGRYLTKKLREIQALARASDSIPTTERGSTRSVPPELIIKSVYWNQYINAWQWTPISGPDWLRGGRDDPHGSKEDARICHGPQVVVPALATSVDIRLVKPVTRVGPALERALRFGVTIKE